MSAHADAPVTIDERVKADMCKLLEELAAFARRVNAAKRQANLA